MNEFSKRLVLRYNPGQFSFTRFDTLATDTELYSLGRQLNSVQADEAVQIVKIEVFQLR